MASKTSKRGQNRRIGSLEERVSAVESRPAPAPAPPARPPSPERRGRGGGGRGRPRTPSVPKGSRDTLVAMLAAWLLLVAYADAQNKAGLSANERRAALAGAIVATLVIGFLGELAPSFATGLAAILLLAMILGGPANGLLVLTKTVPSNLLKGAS